MLRALLCLLAASPVVATGCTTITNTCMAAIQTKKDMNPMSLMAEVSAAGVCPWIKTLFATCMSEHPCCCCDSTFQTAVQSNVATFLDPYESMLSGYSGCKNEVTQCRAAQGCPTSFPPNACPVSPAPTPTAPISPAPTPTAPSSPSPASTASSTPSSAPSPTTPPSVAVAPSPSSTLPDSCVAVTATCNAELSAQAAALTSTDPQVQLSKINQIVKQGGPCPWLKSVFASCMAGGATAECCCCSCAMTDQFKQYGTLFATTMQSLGYSFDCEQDIMQCKEDTCPSATCPAAVATPSSSAIAPALSAAPAPASSNNPDFCPFVPPTVPSGPCSEVTAICEGELSQKLLALQDESTRAVLLFQVLIAGGPCPYFKNMFATCMAGDTTGCCCCSCTMTTTVQTFSAVLSTTLKSLGYDFDCEDDIMQCKEATCPSAACPAPSAVATPSPSSSEDANYCPYVPPPSITIPDQCKPVQTKCTTELLIRGAKLNDPATQVAMAQEILAAGSPCAYFKNMFASCMADDTHCCCCSCSMTRAMKELVAQISPQIKSLGYAFDCEDDIMQCKEDTCVASGTCPPPAPTSPDFSKYCAANVTTPVPGVVAPAPSSASGAGQKYKWRVKLNGTWHGESDCNKILSLKGLLSQKLGAGIPFSPGRLDNAYSCYPFYDKHQLLDFEITDMLTTPDVQQANQEMELMASSNSLASVNAQQKPFTGGDLVSLTPYPPLCIDHCDSACNNHCTCTDCHVKITFSLAKSDTYKNVLTLNQLQQSRGYIASESNVVETNIDVAVLSGNYDPKKGYAVPNVKEPAPIIPLTLVMTVWSRDKANTAVVRAHMVENLVDISNEIARITDRGAAFVEKIEGGSSSTGGGADTPFVNPATDPTKETSSPAPGSTVPTDDTSAADAANEKEEEKDTTTIIVSIVVTLLVVGVLFGAVFFFLKRRSNHVPHQKLSSGPDDLEHNRMEMTMPSSSRRLTKGGSESNIDRRSRFELDRKKTKVGSIEVRDNPMNLMSESTKHDEYHYDDDKIEQAKKQDSMAAVATVVGTGDLPEGWLSNLDEDGDEYWYNHDLGESTYDRPT